MELITQCRNRNDCTRTFILFTVLLLLSNNTLAVVRGGNSYNPNLYQCKPHKLSHSHLMEAWKSQSLYPSMVTFENILIKKITWSKIIRNLISSSKSICTLFIICNLKSLANIWYPLWFMRPFSTTLESRQFVENHYINNIYFALRIGVLCENLNVTSNCE